MANKNPSPATRFKKGQPRPANAGKKKGSRHMTKIPIPGIDGALLMPTTKMRDAMRLLVETDGALFLYAMRRGLAADPPYSAKYADLAGQFGLMKDLEPPDANRGLQIVLTRPIGTDPLAEGYVPPGQAEIPHAQSTPPTPGVLTRAAAALQRRPRRAPGPDETPTTVEVDGEEFDVR